MGVTQQVPPATKETTQQAHAELASGTVEDGQAESLETLQNAQTGEPSRGSNEEAVPEASAAAARKVRIAPSTTLALGAVKAEIKRQAKIQAKSNAPEGVTQQVPPATKETTQQAHAELASGTVEDGQAESLETLQNAQTGEPSRGSNEEAVPEA